MNRIESNSISYFTFAESDESWGIVVTTVGYQPIPPYSRYPLSKHPETHLFNPEEGRILTEYQLIYITKGQGWFESSSCRRTRIDAGTIILLYPGEWHTYQPDQKTGWFEYWVGFKGVHIDKRVENGFFTTKKPLYEIGISKTIINLYESIVNYAIEEKSGYQQLVSSIVLMILGHVYYKYRNKGFSNSLVVDKINEGRTIMKQEIENPQSPEEIAQQLGVSYSWFRHMFKKYTGISPSQYQLQLKLLKSKELLERSDQTVSEIAYKLGFYSPGQFCTYFKKKEGLSPSQYRKNLNSHLSTAAQAE